MSKETARIRRSKKLRANLHKNGIMRICISKSLKNISAQLIDSSNGNVLQRFLLNKKHLVVLRRKY